MISAWYVLPATDVWALVYQEMRLPLTVMTSPSSARPVRRLRPYSASTCSTSKGRSGAGLMRSNVKPVSLCAEM